MRISRASRVIAACVALVSIGAVSCSRKSAEGAEVAEGSSSTAANIKSEVVELKSSGVILFDNAAVYEEKDGAMVYKTTANIGNVVRWKNTVKKATRKSDGQEREFAEIEIDGATLWIQTPFIASEALPGVIIGEETVLYKKADAASPTGKTIATNTLVGVHPDSKAGNFIAISAYLDGDKAPLVTRQFVKAENVITDANDVRALQLYTIAAAAKDPVIKKELLKSALEGNSRFSDLIQAELDKLTAPADVAAPATTAFTGVFTVNDESVNVRDTPNAVSGAVIAQLAKGASVNVTEKTVESYTVDGQSAPWYKIAEPAGWVFGSFLSE